MQTQKDKVIIDTSDTPDLKEYFTRLEPGDECSAKTLNMSLDSFDDGIAILSINDVELEKPKGVEGAEGAEADKDDDVDENEPVSAKLYKTKKKEAAQADSAVGEVDGG
jgi:hypothetical protein